MAKSRYGSSGEERIFISRVSATYTATGTCNTGSMCSIATNTGARTIVEVAACQRMQDVMRAFSHLYRIRMLDQCLQ